uniref:Cytosine deaminase n=1 Tax=Mycena chlorophos TaxID=658473 RepID=A0ABQ0L1U8_MYCCL|nr:cytosine deaminase [Mycena chlorophos]
MSLTDSQRAALDAAYDEACRGYSEGGIPIGCVLVDSTGTIIGRGHNQRIQKTSATLHAEIAALEDAGRLKASVYRDSTIYTTLSPCSMCTGAILLYKIPRVVVGENVNFLGEEQLLRDNGVEITVADDEKCEALMSKFIRERPEDWNEDIGV